MVPIKHNVFLRTATVLKNTVDLIGTAPKNTYCLIETIEYYQKKPGIKPNFRLSAQSLHA